MNVNYGMNVMKQKNHNIFKFKNQGTVESRFVGAQLPCNFHQYLTLYSLAKGVSKTIIIKEVLEQWMNEKQEMGFDDNVLMTLIASVIYQKSQNSSNKNTFFKKAKLELQRKGLDSAQVETIFQRIIELNDTKNKYNKDQAKVERTDET